MANSSSSNHRLLYELKQIKKYKTSLYDVYCIDDDIRNWHVIFYSNNEGFKLSGSNAKIHANVKFYMGYPKVQPRITISHRLPHPNVDVNGSLCMDVLNSSSSSSGSSPAPQTSM